MNLLAIEVQLSPLRFQKQNKMMKINRRIRSQAIIYGIFLVITIFLFSSLVAGLGIAPGEKKIAFQADSVQKIRYTVLNNEHKDFVVSIYADGEIGKYVKIENAQVSLSADEDKKDFYIDVNLPSSLHPGDNTGRIIAEESIENLSFMGAVGKGRIRVISNLIVMVPYPEKYIDVQLGVQEKENNTEITATITNLGLTDIKNLGADVGIYEGETQIQNLNFKFDEQLARGKETSSISEVKAEKLPGGVYSVVARIKYDDYTLEVSRDFEVGKEALKISSYTKYFLENSMNKFEIDAKSDWNQKIKNAYATIDITRYNEEVASLRSASYDIAPRETKIITAYWDTSKLELGKYNANLSLIYLNKSTNRQDEISILDAKTYSQMMAKPFYKSWLFIIIIVLAVGKYYS